MFLKQSTASQEISLGYFLDTTDGNTEETGLTIANTDIKIRKGGGTTLINKNSGGGTHISNGIYSAVLDATDTNTLGDLVIYCHPTGALATKQEYTVLPAASYDALITNGLNDISTAQVNTEVDTALSDYDGPTNAEMNARTILSADYATSTQINNVPTVSEFDARTIASANYATSTQIGNVPTVSEFDARTLLSAGYATATSLATVDSIVDAILVDTGTTLPATLTDMSGATFSTSTDSLEAIRNRGDTSWITGGGGSAPTVSQIRIEMDNNSTKLAAILADTNDLQVNQDDWLTATGFATTAEIANVPTVAEFNARTLLSASYFDPATDAVANVTLVGTTTTNTDMRGTNSALLASGYTAPDNAGITSNGNAIGALNNITVSDVLTTQMTESYAADGTAPTLAQAIFLSMQNLQDFSFAGTTQTVKRIDGSTTAATYTLDDAAAPTSKTRAT
jgi:hypothetical protein